MLSVEQLYVNYGEKEILHDVDLQVAQEEIVMIVGESGSGKSTLVRSIMGLLGEESQCAGSRADSKTPAWNAWIQGAGNHSFKISL